MNHADTTVSVLIFLHIADKTASLIFGDFLPVIRNVLGNTDILLMFATIKEKVAMNMETCGLRILILEDIAFDSV